ncbi:hypothetical protein QTP88_011378 [Uroleucon formosanum]
MPPKIITPINKQSSATNSIQSGSNAEANPLKIVISKNTQNTPSNNTDWIIKTGKRTSSPGNSPTSKAINNNLDKFTYTTPNRYEALNALSEESNNENDVANRLSYQFTIIPYWKIVEKYLEAPLPMSMSAKPTSPDEINTIIKNIPAK